MPDQPTTDPRAALTVRIYDSLAAFNQTARWPVLQLAQIRQHLAEHLAADLAGHEPRRPFDARAGLQRLANEVARGEEQPAVPPPPAAQPLLLAAAYTLELDRDASGGEGAEYLRGMTRAVALLRMLNEDEPAGSAHLPRRGDAVEQWLRARRDDQRIQSPPWTVLDDALDAYRLHADTGTPLGEHACDGPHCECAEAQPNEESDRG